MNRLYVMQLVRSLQCGEINHHHFLKQATLALGSVATAQWLLTATITSPNPSARPVIDPQPSTAPEPALADIVTTTVNYPSNNDKPFIAYLARPKEETPRPAVVVIQEWWGLNDHIKDVTRRFAQAGFVALAPDLYHGVAATEPDEARKLVMQLDMVAAVKEIQQGMAYLRQQPFVSSPKVGVVGFCMGGGLVLQTALVEDHMSAGVAFYGRPLTPEEAAKVKAPILGLYGSDDQGIPVQAVNTMAEGFKAAGIKHEVHIYDGAPHAFFNDSRASTYKADTAADAWQRTLAWFRNE